MCDVMVLRRLQIAHFFQNQSLHLPLYRLILELLVNVCECHLSRVASNLSKKEEKKSAAIVVVDSTAPMGWKEPFHFSPLPIFFEAMNSFLFFILKKGFLSIRRFLSFSNAVALISHNSDAS